jgi:hypothetical protein
VLPVPNNVPVPLGPEYQFIVEPEPAVPPAAVMFTVVLGQVIEGAESVGTVEFVKAVIVAVEVVVQLFPSVIVTE